MFTISQQIVLRQAAEKLRQRKLAYYNLDHHRDTCPTCSKPGMSIDVMRNGDCVEGRRIAEAAYNA